MRLKRLMKIDVEWGDGDDIEWIGQGERTEGCFSIVFLCSLVVF